MVNPGYAVNFISIVTQVTATLLGFGIFAYFFWYEHIGNKIKIEITPKFKGFRVFRRDGKFHKRIIRNRKPLFMKFKNFSKFCGSHIIYNFLEGKWVKYRYTKVNSQFYYRASIIALFFAIIMFGAGVITYNISLLYGISQFTDEQLVNYTSFNNVLNSVQEIFRAFIGGFLIILMIIVVETIGYEYEGKKTKIRCFGKNKTGKRCKRMVKLPKKYCYQHKR